MKRVRQVWVLAIAGAMSATAVAAEKRPERVLAVAVNRDGVARVGAGESAPPQTVGVPVAAERTTPTTGGPCSFGNPPSPAEAEALVRRIAAEESVDGNLGVAVARSESGFRMDQVSPKGAIGLMQLMPATAKRFGVDPCDPEGNVRGGARYLRVLQGRYRNPLLVIAAYNAGEDAVEQHRGVPPYPETVRYVAAVLNDLNGWPKPGAPGPRPRRGVPFPDPSTEPGWSQGFVMHVEN